MGELRAELGGRIRSLRKSAELSQEKLSERAELSYKFLGEVERGQVNVSIDSLERIAKALKVKVIDLFLEEDAFLQKELNKKKALLSPQKIITIKKAIQLLNEIF